MDEGTRVIDLDKTVPNKDPNENIVKELHNIYKDLHELNKNLMAAMQDLIKAINDIKARYADDGK